MISLLGHLEVFGPADELVASGLVLSNAMFKFEIAGHTPDGDPVLVGQHIAVKPGQVQDALNQCRSLHEHISSATECGCADMRTEWQEAIGSAWTPES
jgi:hypothetical protein